jgi:hypothetical protein
MIGSNGLQTSLVELCRTHPRQEVYTLLSEGLELGATDPRNADGLRPGMFSIRECAEAFCGESWVQQLNPGAMFGRGSRGGFAPIQEASESVDVTSFSNITGQIVYYQIKEKWEEAALIADSIVEKGQTDLDGEKVPWISPIVGNGFRVHPGMPYESLGFNQEWIQTVALDTYGLIVRVHKLTVFYDRTGQILREAGAVGASLARNYEFRVLDTLLGTSASPLFNWKGVSYAPYQTNGTYWSNDIYSNPLFDWTAFRRVELAATKVLEPDLAGGGVNMPIEIDLDTIICTPYRAPDVRRMVHATELQMYNLASAPNSRTGSPNADVIKPYKILESKVLRQRALDGLGLSQAAGSGIVGISDSTQVDELYFMMDSKRKPIIYKQNWPLVVVNAPPQNMEEFTQDIVFQAKASERGNASWQDPRMVFRCRGTAT